MDKQEPAIGKNSRRNMIAAVVILIVVIAAAIGGGYFLVRTLKAPAETHPFAGLPFEAKKFENVSQEVKDAFDITLLHSEAKTEWWYVNSHLVDDRGKEYTFMITLLKPASIYGLFASVDKEIAYPIVTMDALRVDQGNRTLGGHNFSLTQKDPDLFCYQLTAAHPVGSIELEMCANKPPLAVSGDGEIKMGKTGQSKYYSLTNMTLRGRIAIGDNPPFPVRGRGWIDRQWGNWKTEDFDQWQWFSIHLYNNAEIMLFNFIRGGKSITPLGEIIYPDGTVKHNIRFRMETLDNWVSPRTGISWSSGWRITLHGEDTELIVKPDFANQEIDKALWEGGCRVTGNIKGKPVKGQAFYEERRKTWEDRKRDLYKQGVFY